MLRSIQVQTWLTGSYFVLLSPHFPLCEHRHGGNRKEQVYETVVTTQ